MLILPQVKLPAAAAVVTDATEDATELPEEAGAQSDSSQVRQTQLS